MNGFKTETMKKHYKANRTLRVRIADENAKKPINKGFAGLLNCPVECKWS